MPPRCRVSASAAGMAAEGQALDKLLDLLRPLAPISAIPTLRLRPLRAWSLILPHTPSLSADPV